MTQVNLNYKELVNCYMNTWLFYVIIFYKSNYDKYVIFWFFSIKYIFIILNHLYCFGGALGSVEGTYGGGGTAEDEGYWTGWTG